jgi:hypothetical protein
MADENFGGSVDFVGIDSWDTLASSKENISLKQETGEYDDK